MVEAIKFHDAELLGDQEEDFVWVPIKPICDAIGVDSQSQQKGIKKHPVLSRVHKLRYVQDASGRRQEMFSLRLDYVHGWLFGIGTEKVKESALPTLILYQEECYQALYKHFFGDGRQTRNDAQRENLLLGRNKEINRVIRDLMKEQGANKLELQTIQNRRAATYHLEPVHVGAEIEYQKHRFLVSQLSIEINNQ